MGFLKKFLAGAAVGAAGVAYARAITARNARLERPLIRDASGEPLPVEVFRYRDGERVEFVDAGEGRTLVWIPGADGPKETFRYQLPRFARDHRVVCADLRATFGETDGLDRFVEDVLELLGALEVERFVLIGQSLGSAIAMRFASLFPERLDGMVLANPVSRVSYAHVGLNRSALIPLAMGTTRYLPTPLSRSLARAWSRLGLWIFDDSPGRDALIEYALFTGPRTVPARISEDRVRRLKGTDLRPLLPKIDVPALVVKGPHDVYCPVSWALEIADLLPDAEYAPIPGTGHCSHISRPGAFNGVLEAWLAKLPRRVPELRGGDGRPQATSMSRAGAETAEADSHGGDE